MVPEKQQVTCGKHFSEMQGTLRLCIDAYFLLDLTENTIKLWCNNVMNESDASSYHWLLCIIYMCYLLNHIVYSKDPQIPYHRLTTDGGDCGS